MYHLMCIKETAFAIGVDLANMMCWLCEGHIANTVVDESSEDVITMTPLRKRSRATRASSSATLPVGGVSAAGAEPVQVERVAAAGAETVAVGTVAAAGAELVDGERDKEDCAEEGEESEDAEGDEGRRRG